MKIKISSSLLETLNKTHKNPDYSLMCLINCLDAKSSAQVYKVLNKIDFGKDKKECDVSNDTLETISNLFGSVDATLIETLIWVSAFLPEI